jgi:hypothetical protein
MPFTLFHFGPGLLAKAAAPTRVSFTAFAVTQVFIDIETLYHLVRRDWPVHGQLHSFIGASSVGLLAAGAVFAGRPILNRFLPANATSAVTAELTAQSAVIGGLLGGATHTVLDAIMHPDVSPLWPFAPGNGLVGLVSAGVLEAGCVLAAVIGLSLLWLRRKQRRLVV